jgi:hypothetical protein
VTRNTHCQAPGHSNRSKSSHVRSATLDEIRVLPASPFVPVIDSPAIKRRPIALTLRTSNLTPTRAHHSARKAARPATKLNIASPPNHCVDDYIEQLGSDDSNYTIVPAREGSATQHETASLPPKLDTGVTERLSRRRSNSIGNALPDVSRQVMPSHPTTVLVSSASDSQADPSLTPASSIRSSNTYYTPSDTFDPSPRSFDNIPLPYIPLPWALVSTNTLRSSMGDPGFERLLERTLHSDTSPPSMLPPTILKTSTSEDERLRAELTRLRGKYDILVRHRDSLLAQIEGGLVKSNVDILLRVAAALRTAVTQCDRVARQIYICNDQIRQIQIQGVQHMVGALRVARSLDERVLFPTTSPSSTYSSADVSSCEMSAAVESKADTHRDATTEQYLHTRRTNFWRASTASVLSANHLGFPLPPDRGQQIERPVSSNRSSSASQLDFHKEYDGEDNSNEILIYPPSHRRSRSAPLMSLELPHTPWRSCSDHSGQATNFFGEHTTLTPSGTAPLRVKTARKNGGEKGVAKAQSLAMKRPVSSEMKRRAKRGRDTQLETVSISAHA